MSHFTVMVVSDTPDEVDSLLAPFNEQDEEFFEKVNITEETMNDYERFTSTRYINTETADGIYYERDAVEVKRPATKQESFDQQSNFSTFLERHPHIVGTTRRGHDELIVSTIPDNFKKVEVPYKELMTFKEFAIYWCNEDNVEEEGDTILVFSRYNPDAKWDWYSLGGRWAGCLKLKDGMTGVKGRGSLLFGSTDQEVEKDFTVCDQSQKKNIDFTHESMKDFWTFAALSSKGEWIEIEEWGHASPKEELIEKFNAFLETVGDEQFISIIDCHS